ncbi:hypothetical protein SDC9_125011 [bioreactor metagenome]|uniref:Uncharacterized protein n=1 Tax=bioreactor metagenome TaxID=1076179 RepID=A0A645CM24_9ZZZZ
MPNEIFDQEHQGLLPSSPRYTTHAFPENRNGLIVDVKTTEASGSAEWEAAQQIIELSIKKSGATIGFDNGDLRIRWRTQALGAARSMVVQCTAKTTCQVCGGER